MKHVTFDIYARISDDKKRDTDLEGLNVDEQVKICTAWINDRDGTVGEVYRDDSKSATSGKQRPDFERMLTDEPRPVVYWKQSRLERDPGDLDRFLLSGREGHGTDGTRATLESASAEFLSRLMSLTNRFEQRNKAEFQRAANLRLAQAGKYRGAIRPFGQTTTGEWVEDEAEAVRAAARDLLDETATFYTIAKRWNAANLLTPQTGKQGGNEWTSGTVRNYYTRPRLIGKQEYAGTLYDLKDWPPLLDEDTFNSLQSLINSKRTGKRGVSKGRGDARLLTGIVKCECGRGMNVAYRGKKGSPRIYRCPTVGHQTVTAEPLELVVSDHALSLMAQQDEGKAEAEEATERIAALLDERRLAQAQHETWIDEAVKARLSPALIAKAETAHAEALSALDDQIMQQRAALGVNLFAVTHSWVGGDLETDLTGWNDTPVHQRRDVLQSLFFGVLVTRGEQGQRFKADRVGYDYTPLGKRLHKRWAENYLGVTL